MKIIRLITISLIVFFSLGFTINLLSDFDEYFDIANEKLKKYKIKNKDYVVIIDYRKNLFRDRLYLLDMNNKKVILNCKVSHALNTGIIFPTDFSNIPNTNKSSVGAFISKNSRLGRYGYSMVISGLDKGINNNVEKRAIIFHPTPAIPWSFGCFATMDSNNKIIIDHMKNGRLIYVIN
jgi:hypothetical protein